MIDDIKRQLHRFFPGQTFPISEIEAGVERGEILTEMEKILPYLQTALLDEKVLEVELDGMPRVYCSRLKDDFSDSIENEDFELQNEDDYNEALAALEEVLESSDDSPNDPLNLLIDMLSQAISQYEAQDEELIAVELHARLIPF